MKRKGKEKANNTVVELVTSHFKEFSTTNNDMIKIIKDFITVVGKKATTVKDAICLRDEEQAHKLMMQAH